LQGREHGGALHWESRCPNEAPDKLLKEQLALLLDPFDDDLPCCATFPSTTRTVRTEPGPSRGLAKRASDPQPHSPFIRRFAQPLTPSAQPIDALPDEFPQAVFDRLGIAMIDGLLGERGDDPGARPDLAQQ
jgi:hypothetical protein